MSEEPPSAAGRSAHTTPGLRASHEDRERAAEKLRVAAGEGRLTTEELDDRLGVALTARTTGELAALTGDLPTTAPGTAAPKGSVRLECRGGKVTRRGRWVVPEELEVRVAGGTVRLDFSEAVITAPTVRIRAEVRGGSLVLVTKPGIEVDADDVTVHGGRVSVSPRNGWGEPTALTVALVGGNHGGRIVARPPRRRFGRWVRRRPGPSLDAASR